MTNYTFSLPKEFEMLLEKIAKEKGTSKAEIIRRALVLYSTLNEERSQGNKVIIKQNDEEKNQETEIRILF